MRKTLEEVAGELPNDPVVVVADLADPSAPQTIVEQAEAVVGKFDVLVNNAGGGDANGPANTVSVDKADAMWALNLRAPILLGGRRPVVAASSGDLRRSGSTW